VRLKLPSYRWLPRDLGSDFIHAVSLTRLPPGSLVMRYEGIEGVVVRKATSRLKSLWNDSIRDRYEADLIDYDEYGDELTDMGNACADFDAGGRWWDRSWLDSLTPERGGAPERPVVCQIGERLEVFRLGPLSVTNDLRARIDHLTVLRIDPDAGQIYRHLDVRRLAHEHAHLRRDADEQDDHLPPLSPEDGRRQREAEAAPAVRIILDPPDPGLLPGRWRLHLRPAASINPMHKGSIIDMVRDLSLRASLELYMGARPKKFMEIEALARFDPSTREATLAIEVSLVQW
jgi:hypothetical protein